MNYFGPKPNTTVAYATDNAGNEYFGECGRDADVSRPRWTITQKKNTGGLTNPTAWIMLFPVYQGTASDQPVFVWTSATTGAYTYRELGT